MGDPSILRAGETDNQTMTIRLQPGNLATWSVTNNFLPGGNSLSLSTYLTYLPTHLCTSPEIQLNWGGGLFFEARKLGGADIIATFTFSTL